MVIYKKFIIPFFLLIEIICCGIYYVYASHGLSYLIAFSHANNDVLIAIKVIQHDIELLKEHIQDSAIYPYYKEKIAREQLQVMLPDERVFYII